MFTLSGLATTLVPRLITMLVVGIFLGLIYWLLSFLPIPEPFKGLVTTAFIIIAVLILLLILLGGVTIGL